MEKKDYCKRVALWAAVVLAAIILLVGLGFGRIIEGTLFAEVSKWVAMSLVVIGIVEGFIYVAVGPLLYHFLYERKRNGKG